MIKQKRHAFFQIFFFLAVQLIVFLGFSKTAHADVTKTITFEIRNLGSNASIIPTHVNDRNGVQTPLGTCTSGNIATYNWTTRAGTVIGSITVDMTTSGKATITLNGVSVDNGNTPYFTVNGGTKTGYHPSGWVPNTPTQDAGLSGGIEPNRVLQTTFNTDGTCFFYAGAGFKSQYEEIMWTPNIYTLTLNSTNGVASFTGGGQYTYGTTASTTATAAAGYHLTYYYGTLWDGSGNSTFTGCSGQSSHAETWTMNANRTITAYAAPNTYTVTYNGNGATGGSMGVQSVTFNDSFMTTPNAFTREGYTFNGWNMAANGSHSSNWGLTAGGVYESGKAWTWSYAYSITLYAQWVPNTYTVSYNGNGATSGTMSNQAMTFDKAAALNSNQYRS